MASQKWAIQPVSVACRDVNVSVGKKSLLRHVNLLVEPGELLIVAGPSGAGKTSLLNSIAFRMKNGSRTGDILFNGHNGTVKTFRAVANYVMTDGRMLPYLTVHETLQTAAKLKLPELTKEERETRISCVMTELGLQKCRNTYIGGEWKKGISTGERKRVSIAIELLSEPSVLILDEPTSGLDSTLACELLSVLQRLTSSGRTVICSIHQPTSQMWSQFGQLALLSRGSIIYHGKATDAKEYFSNQGFDCPKNYNPADFFLSLIADVDNNELSGREESSGANSTAEASVASSHRSFVDGIEVAAVSSPVSHFEKLLKAFPRSKESDGLKKRIDAIHSSAMDNPEDKVKIQKFGVMTSTKTWCCQVKALYGRSFKNSIRNPIVCCVMLLVQALQGIILGGIFWQLPSDIAGQQPLIIDAPAIIQNPWAQVFIHGIDGKQPLLDALEEGVDGKGSQPLFMLLNDTASLEWIRKVVTCAVEESTLNGNKYPTFGVRGSKHSGEGFTPMETIGNVVGLAQIADWEYMKADFSSVIGVEDDTLWWGQLTSAIAVDLLNPFMGCAGYPTFGASRRRQLITIGDTGIEDAMIDFLGVGASDFVTASTDILTRLRGCDNRACKWIGKKYQEAMDIGQDSYDATMVVVNILGALFFAVANLGFSSYEALLTFPQERALFNRESASGLYRTSSYFLAKNLADLPFQLIPSFVLVTIYYFFVGLGGSVAQYVLYAIICAGITFAAYGFGYLVSAASPRMEIAVLIAPVILVIWLTIAGFFLRDEQIPKWIGWFSYVSFYKWGFFSLVTNQFPVGGTFGLMSNRIPLLMAGITDTRLWVSIVLLITLGFVYRILAYFALKYTNRKVGLQS